LRRSDYHSIGGMRQSGGMIGTFSALILGSGLPVQDASPPRLHLFAERQGRRRDPGHLCCPHLDDAQVDQTLIEIGQRLAVQLAHS
jgi:hypothetical protein